MCLLSPGLWFSGSSLHRLDGRSLSRKYCLGLGLFPSLPELRGVAIGSFGFLSRFTGPNLKLRDGQSITYCCPEKLRLTSSQFGATHLRWLKGAMRFYFISVIGLPFESNWRYVHGVHDRRLGHFACGTVQFTMCNCIIKRIVLSQFLFFNWTARKNTAM